jgi:hypothetical protein
MYILFMLSHNGTKETQSYYKYSTENDILADFEIKLGQGMKDANTKALSLVAFEHTGNIIAQGGDYKDESIKFALRYIRVKSTAEGEQEPVVSTRETERDMKADYLVEKGNARKDANLLGELFLGYDNGNVVLNDYLVPDKTPKAED